MLNILITGATGFVGSQVLKHLNQQEVSLRVISRSDSGDSVKRYINVKEVIKTKNIFLEESSLLENICKDIDIVIHCAWYAEPGKYLKSPLNEDCFQGTIRFAQAAAKKKIKRFVGIGSCFEYDLFTEDKIDTSTPLRPLTQYARSKVQTFEALTDIFSNNEIEFLWARLFYLYGEGEDERRLIPVLRKRLRERKKVSLTEGSEIRDYLDVSEAGKIISNLSLSKIKGPFNVCSGKGVTIKELARKIAKEYDAFELLEFGKYKVNPFESPYIVGKKYKI